MLFDSEAVTQVWSFCHPVSTLQPGILLRFSDHIDLVRLRLLSSDTRQSRKVTRPLRLHHGRLIRGVRILLSRRIHEPATVSWLRLPSRRLVLPIDTLIVGFRVQVLLVEVEDCGVARGRVHRIVEVVEADE